MHVVNKCLMTYPGGKNAPGAYPVIINQIPPHRVYIEGFLGSGAILRTKRAAEVSIGIDVDPVALSVFQTEHPCRHLSGSMDPELLDVVLMEERQRSRDIKLATTFIRQGSAIDFLRNYRWHGDEFVYLDPPYLGTSRRRPDPIYTHEFAEEWQHRQLLDAVQDVGCPVMISGYDSQLYTDRLTGWRVVTYPLMTRGGTMATEYLWCNYQEPVQLHDYRFLGRNKMERQALKRKTERWTARLAGMSTLERQAMLAAIEDFNGREKHRSEE